MKFEWKRAVLGTIVVIATVAILSYSAAAQKEGKAPKKDAGANGPLYLPEHNYDHPGSYVSAAEIQAHLVKMVAEKKDDEPISMVKIGGKGDKAQAGISVVYREPENPKPGYAVHDDVAEVYYILEGSGTMMIGGKLTDAQRRPVSPGNGMGLAGKENTTAKLFTLGPGDTLIIPAGTPHLFLKANMFTSYICVRIDGDGVTPLEEPNGRD